MTLVILLIFVAIVLESSIISAPLTLSALIAFSFIYKKEWLLIIAAVSGFVLDILMFRNLQVSSFLFLSLVFLVLLYEKKLEASSQVILIVSFIASILYTLLINGEVSLLSSLSGSVLAVLIFILFTKSKSVKTQNKSLRFEI